MQLRVKGIVLSETPYGESSKILNVLTDEYGLIGVISKGSKNIKSKLRGISNKMNYCEYTISYKENGLSTLIEGNTINSFKNIYINMNMAMYSFYIMDLVYQVLKENNNKELFDILENALTKINDGLSPELISIIVELKLLKYLGVMLNLDSCTNCGKKDNLITIDVNSGGLLCQDCYSDGYIFDTKSLNLIIMLNKINLGKISKLEITDEKVYKDIENFMYEYYSTYTGIYLKKKNKLSTF